MPKVVGLQTHIWANNLKSMFLLATFPIMLFFIIFLIIMTTGIAAGAPDIINYTIEIFISLSCFIFMGTSFWFLIAWAFHKKMITGMTHSTPITRANNPRVYNIVENLSISRGIRTPQLYEIRDNSLNAYATGLSPNNSIIAFSTGAMNVLNDRELEAVAAHELTHILNRDTRLMVVAIIFVGIIQTISEFFLRSRVNVGSGSRDNDSGNGVLVILLIKLVIFIVGFLFTILVQLAISRKREFLADAGAVELTKSSEHLISALEKIDQDPRIEAISNRSVAQLCIDNPLNKLDKGFLTKLFSTHPSMSDRIAALRMIG